KHNIAPFSAISAVWTAFINVNFVTEADCPIATFSGLNQDFSGINKHISTSIAAFYAVRGARKKGERLALLWLVCTIEKTSGCSYSCLHQPLGRYVRKRY